MNHKEVQIRRRETKSHLPPPVVANAKKVLSSIYDGQGPLTGFSTDEAEKEKQRQWLCEYLGLESESKDVSFIIRDWWADLRVEVPTDGVVLNVSTDDEKKPINIKDYLVLQWATKHKFVGKDQQDMLNNPNKQFYIYDPDVEMKHQHNKVKIKRKAYEQFILIADDNDKIDLVLKVLTDSDPSTMSEIQKQNYIDQLIESDPAKFVSVVTDKHIEVKALISDLVSYNIVTQMSNQYWWIDELLGNDIEETVKFFMNKKNTQTINRLKAKLEEAKK